MRNCFTVVFCFLFVLWMMCFKVNEVLAYSSGPPFGRTGSPADNFKTCKDTDCHNAHPLNYGTAKFSISPQSSYSLGEVLTLTVSFKNSHAPKHGFELSALDGNNNHVGKFSSFPGDTKTQTSTDGNYIEHTFKGCNQSGNARWNVKWTAPSSEVQDPVTFYAAGNEADGNHKHGHEHDGYPKHGDDTHDGDYVYTTTVQVSSAATTPTVTPSATATPTPTECETESISASPNKLRLKKEQSDEVIVTLIPAEGCLPEKDEIVTAKITKADKKRISVSSQNATTDVNGEVKFTITAKKKTGKARVKFRYKDFIETIKVDIVN